MVGKIAELCKEKNMSMAELERKAGLKARTIYKWDESKPSVDKAVAVARVLDVTVNELMEGDDTNNRVED